MCVKLKYGFLHQAKLPLKRSQVHLVKVLR